MKCLKISDLKNKVINDNCLNVLRKIRTNSIPLIVTSPPYNLRKTSGKWTKNTPTDEWFPPKYDLHDDDMDHFEYVLWQREFIREALRVLKPDGAMFYNHKWRVQAGRLQERHDITDGFPLRQIIIWQRAGGINFSPTFFLPTYEVLYLFAGPKFRVKKGFVGLGDIWKIPQALNNPHPAPFPLEVPLRCIRSTNTNLVLDPFAGSGTTAVAANQLGCDFICIEKSKDYCDLAINRINNLPK